MLRFVLITIVCCTAFPLWSQYFITRTFKDTRLINTHSVEMLKKRKFDLRIGHRFGNLKDGWDTFYGLESATDVLFSFEYGVNDKLNVAISRAKGAGPLNRLASGYLKYALLQQTENTPISIVALGVGCLSTMDRNEDNPAAINHFDKFSHRLLYTTQLLVARNFSDRFAFQIIPSYTHLNVTSHGGVNDIVSLGFATRLQINKVFGIIADATFPFTSDDNIEAAIGIGLEIETGGHVFQMNFTNAAGIMEPDYISSTNATWADEFRFGFTVSRVFNL